MINKWQTFFLLVLTLPIMGHVVLLPFAIDLAGRDSWLSAVFSFMLGVIFFYGIYRLRRYYFKENINLSLDRFFGPLVTYLFLGVMCVYFFFLAALSLAAVVEMVRTGFLDATPLFVLITLFLLISMYAAQKSVKGIALTAGVLFFIVMFTGHSITFINFSDRELYDLRPFLENGWTPVFLGTLLLSTVWIEALFLLVVPIENIYERNMLAVWFLGVFANVVMMLSTMTGAIMTFGLGQAESFTHPALEIVRIINLKFIDRLDVYALILMTFGSYIRCSLYLKISYQKVIKLFNLQNKWLKFLFFVLVSGFVGTVAYYMADTRINLENSLVVYAYTIVLYPLPFLLLFLVWIRKKRELI